MGANNQQNVAVEAIPIQQQPQGSTFRVFGNIIDAISQIQQFALIEEHDEIPEDFLTIRGKLNYFNVGFGNGFLEGIAFALLTAIILPIISDPMLSAKVSQWFPLAKYKVFMWTLNCIPVIVSVCICSFLSKYRVGTITRKSVDSLLLGRTFSLLLKGGLIFVLVLMLAGNLDSKVAWTIADAVGNNPIIQNPDLVQGIYGVLWHLRPNLVLTAFEILGIFVLSAAIPFITVYLVAAYRMIQRKRIERFWRS